MRVLQYGWKFKGSKFEKEGKVIVGKINRIYIEDVGIGTHNSVCVCGGGGGVAAANMNKTSGNPKI